MTARHVVSGLGRTVLYFRTVLYVVSGFSRTVKNVVSGFPGLSESEGSRTVMYVMSGFRRTAMPCS